MHVCICQKLFYTNGFKNSNSSLVLNEATHDRLREHVKNLIYISHVQQGFV